MINKPDPLYLGGIVKNGIVAFAHTAKAKDSRRGALSHILSLMERKMLLSSTTVAIVTHNMQERAIWLQALIDEVAPVNVYIVAGQSMQEFVSASHLALDQCVVVIDNSTGEFDFKDFKALMQAKPIMVVVQNTMQSAAHDPDAREKFNAAFGDVDMEPPYKISTRMGKSEVTWSASTQFIVSSEVKIYLSSGMLMDGNNIRVVLSNSSARNRVWPDYAVVGNALYRRGGILPIPDDLDKTFYFEVREYILESRDGLDVATPAMLKNALVLGL